MQNAPISVVLPNPLPLLGFLARPNTLRAQASWRPIFFCSALQRGINFQRYRPDYADPVLQEQLEAEEKLKQVLG